MINYLWSFFIVAGIIVFIITGRFDELNNVILSSSSQALELLLTIVPLITLWVGLMNIAKKSGLLDRLAKTLYPVLKLIFPDIPKNHPSLGYIASNIVVNMFGLGSAATPFGLKAMKSLQEINSDKKTASRSMITFLVLNTSGVTIIPTTVISLRLLHGSAQPTEIVITALIATILASIGGLIFDRIFYHFTK